MFPEATSDISKTASKLATVSGALAVPVTKITVKARQTEKLLRPNEQLAGTISLIAESLTFRRLSPCTTRGNMVLDDVAFTMTSNLLCKHPSSGYTCRLDMCTIRLRTSDMNVMYARQNRLIRSLRRRSELRLHPSAAKVTVFNMLTGVRCMTTFTTWKTIRSSLPTSCETFEVVLFIRPSVSLNSIENSSIRRTPPLVKVLTIEAGTRLTKNRAAARTRRLCRVTLFTLVVESRLRRTPVLSLTLASKVNIRLTISVTAASILKQTIDPRLTCLIPPKLLVLSTLSIMM